MNSTIADRELARKRAAELARRKAKKKKTDADKKFIRENEANVRYHTAAKKSSGTKSSGTKTVKKASSAKAAPKKVVTKAKKPYKRPVAKAGAWRSADQHGASGNYATTRETVSRVPDSVTPRGQGVRANTTPTRGVGGTGAVLVQRAGVSKKNLRPKPRKPTSRAGKLAAASGAGKRSVRRRW